MKLYCWNIAKSTWTTFVLYVHIVIPCLLVRAVTYLKFIVWRNIRLFSWRDKIWFFSIVVRGIWFAFCFTLNTFTFILYALLLISLLGKGLWWSFQTDSFFIWGTKKVIACCFRQKVNLHRKDFMGIGLSRLNMALLEKWPSYSGGCLSRFDCIWCKLKWR